MNDEGIDDKRSKIATTLEEMMVLGAKAEDKLEAVRELIMVCAALENSLESQTLKTKQEPKYKIQGPIVNRQSGHAIPDDEPIFILRGRDMTAVSILMFYLASAKKEKCSTEHLHAVQKRITQFKDFAEKHPDRMKKPDTVLTQDWDNL